ncbi:hypothetical protein OS493_007963 [Desmophyllum pertusum]|uniref:Uncharacterized protein n=1 Tax=Desmophyllum pertusum TaxID=174260 RepID=A0A9W9YEQ9_9CNID|nr:hypothetical protein OS493_007963 [Desmophyllum pertusum]
MASQNIARDSGICLSAVQQKSKIPIRVSGSSSDSEQSYSEEPGHVNRRSTRRSSRIPIAVSRHGSGSDSSEENQNKIKPNTTDSGISLRQGQKKDAIIQNVVKKTSKTSSSAKKEASRNSNKILSPRDTKASALRKQAQLKKTASAEKKKKKNKKSPADQCGVILGDSSDDECSNRSEFESDVERQSEDEGEDQTVPLEMQEEVFVQNNEDSSCKSTRSVDLELMPASVENKTSALDEDIEEYSNKNKKLTALDRKNSQELQNRNDVLLDSNEAEEDQGNHASYSRQLEDENKEAEHEEAEHQQTEQQEAEHEETGHQVAEHEETGHQEAEHQEAENQEAGHQEAEHQEDEAYSYSDDSFEETSSEEERTPTFDFKMAPPSIGNSGCGDSNQAMDDVQLQHGKEDTASDVSDIEDQPAVTCEESAENICKGTLQKQQSVRKFFDDVSSEMGQETLEEEVLEHEEFVEIDNEKKVVDDDELNRMDEAIFGLLQSAGQSSRGPSKGLPMVNNHRETALQSAAKVNNYTEGEELNCMQDVYPGMGEGNRSGKKRVRFASEPEVFLVPFSSREFDEPFFDVTDDVPADEVQSESRFKNVKLDPYSKEFVDDLDDLLDDIEEDIQEEISSQEKNAPDLTDDVPTDQVQSESRLKNVNLDPYSKEFVDDLLDDVEEDIQEELSSQEKNALDKEVDLLPGTKHSSESTRCVEDNGSEAVPQQDLETEATFPCQMYVTDAKELEECIYTDVFHLEYENIPETVRENVLEQDLKQGKDFILDATLNRENKSTRWPSIGNEESQSMTEETEEMLPQKMEPFFEATNSHCPETYKNDSFPDEALVPNFNETVNAVTDEGSKQDEKTKLEVTQKYKETLPDTKDNGAESPMEVENMSDLRTSNKRKVTIVANSYIDDLIENVFKQITWDATNSLEERNSDSCHRQEVGSVTDNDVDVSQNMNPEVNIMAGENVSECHEEMASGNSEQSSLQEDDHDIKVQPSIVDIYESLTNNRSLHYTEDSEDTELVRDSTVTETHDEAEIKAIAAELEQLKDLHAKIGDIRKAFNGTKKPDYEKPSEKRRVSRRLSLLQEIRIVMLSVAEMSEDFKTTVVEVLEDSARHNISLERDLEQMKREYLETLDKQNEEIKSFKKCNEELEIQLEEGDQQRLTIECIIQSVNIENEKLLEQNDDLENELKKAMSEKNEIVTELDRKHFKEEYRERELSNLKHDIRWKSFNMEENGCGLGSNLY